MTPDLKAMMEALDKIELWWPDHDTFAETYRLRSGIEAMAAELESLKGILSGDPNCTATKEEERERWRLSSVRYADKVEKELAQAKRKVLEKGADLMSLRADVTGYKKRIRQADRDLSAMKEELAQAKEDTRRLVYRGWELSDCGSFLRGPRIKATRPGFGDKYRDSLFDIQVAIDAASQGGKD